MNRRRFLSLLGATALTPAMPKLPFDGASDWITPDDLLQAWFDLPRYPPSPWPILPDNPAILQLNANYARVIFGDRGNT